MVDLDAIEAMLWSTSPGPWRALDGPPCFAWWDAPKGFQLMGSSSRTAIAYTTNVSPKFGEWGEMRVFLYSEADVKFFASSREIVASLVAEVRRLSASLDQGDPRPVETLEMKS